MPESTITVERLLTRKHALDESRLEATEQPAAVAAGEVLLKLARFALTTNNITYAAFGEAMQYWGFFPTGQADWGHMPVWGFADVKASAAEGIAPGERFYGYFPMASHVRMQAGRVAPRGFYDGAAHRRALTSAYNQYTRVSADAAYAREDEDLQMLLRPLFITSFVLADFLQDSALFGARRVVISNASSKTAYGTAYCLQGQPGIELVALISARNAGFVEGLGCYTRTVDYGALATLSADVPTLYVDFSGDEALRERVHHHFGASLVHDCYVGSAHNPVFLQKDAGLPGPAPKFFFAPLQIKKRNADWGAAEMTRRFGDAQHRFFRHVSTATPPWLQVVQSHGLAAAPQIIAALCAGGLDPRLGQVVVLEP